MSMTGSTGGTTGGRGQRVAERPVAVEHETVVVDVGDESRRKDRVRWGPVWAGLVVALSTYLLLQLILVALGIVDLSDVSTGDALASAAVALVAFFMGGVVVGATMRWRAMDDGLMHGVVLWAAGIVALLVFSAAGGGVALGSIDTSDTFDQLTSGNVDEQAEEDAEEAAGYAALGIVAALVAAVAGSVVGTKMWPDEDDRRIDLTRT